MKEKLINNLGIKILSICLAAFLWVVIINVDDPVKTRTFVNIPVQVLNENTLTSKTKTFDIISGDMVDFMVSGKRSQLEKLRKTDFVATADLSQLTAPFDTVKINVDCTKSQDIQIIMGKISTMKISLEDIVKQRFSIKVDPVGDCAPGYAVGKAEVSPVMLDVSGAESLIEKITDVKVIVDINGADANVMKTVIPKAYNRNGVEIASDKLTFSNKQVTAKVTIQNTKKIPVSIITKGEVAPGYKFLGTVHEPQEIEVKGDNDKLNSIDHLPILIDLTGLKEDKEYTISIYEQLLNYGVSVVDPELQNLVVKVTIKKLEVKEFKINQNDILITGLNEGLRTEFTEENKVYSVTLAGLKDELERLDVQSLAPQIDLSGLGAGKYKLSLKLHYESDIEQKADVKVGIKVMEASSEKPVASKKPEDGQIDNKLQEKPSASPSTEPVQSPSVSPEVPKEDEEDTDKE